MCALVVAMKTLAVVAVGLLAAVCLVGCADARGRLTKTNDSLDVLWNNQKNFTADNVHIVAPDGTVIDIGHISDDPNDANRAVWAGMAKINSDTQATLLQVVPAAVQAGIQGAKKP